jgi:hypothetical protein
VSVVDRTVSRRLPPGRSSSSPPDKRKCARLVPVWALACTALIPIILTSGWVIADAVQPSSYSPMHKTVSVTAGYAGTDRWIVTTALLIAGACYLAAALGLATLRRSARVALVVSGIASIGIAGSPEPVEGSSFRHMVFTTVGAGMIAIWPALTARRGLRPSQLTSIPFALAASTVFLAMLGWLYVETRNGSMLGLAERLDSSLQVTWPFVVALSLFRKRGFDIAADQHDDEAWSRSPRIVSTSQPPSLMIAR